MFGWFEQRLNPFPSEEPVAPPKGLFAFCWHYSKPAAPWLGLMAMLTASIAVGEVALFQFLGDIVDWLTNADRTTFLQTEGHKLFWMAALVLVGLPLAAGLDSLIMHQMLLGNYPMSARWQMHRFLLRHSMTFFANEFAGRVATKVMQTSLAVRETVMKILDVFVYVVTYFLTMIIVIAAADWRLMIPILVWLAVYIGIVAYFVPRLRKIAAQQADARSMMTGRVVDSYTNIATVKLFSHAGREEVYAKEGMDEFLQTVHRQMRKVTLFHISVYLNNCVALFVVSGLSIWFWLNGAISVGAIAIAIGLAMRVNGMSQWIMWEVSALFENIGTVYDGMEMMSKQHDIVDKPGAPVLTAKKGAIHYDRIRFHYGKSKGVIDNLSLDIKAGEKVGLVGRSGAGKTTLMNLLLRFYDLEGGRITIDGQDISGVSQESLRSLIGVVTQDTSLLHRSIRDNIAYGRPEATDAEVIEAAKRANAWEFIEGLVDMQGRAGLDAQVGERGVKLSGGQRQRIAIARVFLKDAPILVLDEATSALDSEVEAAIQENLFALMEGKTVIAIAHRLSTLTEMDRLIVLDKGRIIEAGSHAELIESGGIYADLWNRQSGGFLSDHAEEAEEAAE
ncbi:ATP-binding cassette subfamily B multidrug efflux pump [Rhizobium leguminosarum]|uniref:ATP-binding cassette subfamily B multidrug efflux pump n=1 Tax=Rhizobium leguminosarum TaxID=384 RepID=A0AAE2ML66_RHILE|nr:MULTISPECIES: ABC transporter ATP-binding protein [Rhizobium]MBB4291155.1 ATP-binding cassette subfamily B multidrug efflux pump [Rhizobium leguminosarum]MBB4297749.1 ATP-binding cassette subfamily B multidrug efflux pump [Rhizobium leguminosarum]MBB4308889.1 ATP-binding cassette subfamily B multidrug efflux pump [Rhizobium leguminosarum]MBB4416724.1 ATP-binding cassette subfamily B multidrug efflux pump [Rhizobium leguminosarum]MBB4430308.1 ATP-binding cassette subfamily B multidrug efflux